MIGFLEINLWFFAQFNGLFNLKSMALGLWLLFLKGFKKMDIEKKTFPLKNNLMPLKVRTKNTRKADSDLNYLQK